MEPAKPRTRRKTAGAGRTRAAAKPPVPAATEEPPVAPAPPAEPVGVTTEPLPPRPLALSADEHLRLRLAEMRKALLAELEAFDHSLERHLEGAKQQLREQVAELSQAASTADPADFQRALDLQRTIEELAVRLTLFRQGTDAGIADLSRLARRLRKGARKIKPPL